MKILTNKGKTQQGQKLAITEDDIKKSDLQNHVDGNWTDTEDNYRLGIVPAPAWERRRLCCGCLTIQCASFADRCQSTYGNDETRLWKVGFNRWVQLQGSEDSQQNSDGPCFWSTQFTVQRDGCL